MLVELFLVFDIKKINWYIHRLFTSIKPPTYYLLLILYCIFITTKLHRRLCNTWAIFICIRIKFQFYNFKNVTVAVTVTVTISMVVRLMKLKVNKFFMKAHLRYVRKLRSIIESIDKFQEEDDEETREKNPSKIHR